MISSEFKFLIPGADQDAEMSLEARQLLDLFEEDKSSLMKQLSVYARIQAMEALAEEQKSAVSPEPEPENIDNSLLSDALIHSNWLGKKQLEPQDVINLMAEKMTGTVVSAYKRNVKSVVMLGRKELLDENGMPDTTPLKRVPINTTVIGPDGRMSEEPVSCFIDYRFPFRNQPTVLQDLPDGIGLHKQAFFGTGFFVAPTVIATAGHVVQLMLDIYTENNSVSFIAVQNYRLGIEWKQELQRYEIEPESLGAGFGHNGELQDWAYIKVKKASAHFVEMEDGAHCGKEVYCLGHGLGLPLKMGWNGLVFKTAGDMFRCKLETFSGNSGSPVFCSQTHRALGILRGTDKEFYFLKGKNEEGNYVLPMVYLNGFSGSVFTRIRPLATRLKDFPND